MNKVTIIGIDLAKRVFHAHCAAADCQFACNRDPVFASNRDPCEGAGLGLSMEWIGGDRRPAPRDPMRW